MHLTVKGKQLDVGDALRTHVGETLDSLVSKYFTNPVDGTVILSRDAHLYTADVTVRVGRGILLQSRAEATEPYPAFDLAAERLAKRLRRNKRKLRDHHRSTDAPTLPAAQYILEAGPDDDHMDTEVGVNGHQPTVVAEMQTAIETLTVGEAVMRMDLADLPAMMFRNSAHGELNMVYRRPDGHVGWIDPKAPQGSRA
ncbi:ribosome hibernation-promoting factor, HPF/YfiA family [Arenibaculum pallidiluteum]|uniref:ribosome hibernation-promoting factor, HPF/YfiA family n=1 Tax=Arenibaculum pallidiluteum TaxID=2812559 RepID=UPI001A96ADF8|nr:ribosome-associated translation inhibitor RaiA [Arenibaculum pallidiluteum]